LSDADLHHGPRPADEPLVKGQRRAPEITGQISSIVLTGRLPRRFWWGFAFFAALALMFLWSISYLVTVGVGTYGINIPVAWGTMIANVVWWIGIGHAGTLISAVLLLMRQPWRASINRFAEAMTLFAVAMAGLFPILHLGRPWFFYWLMPLPTTHMDWPQWRSPLVWDFAAIATYGVLSMIFWYMGLIPDLAVLRDRAKSRGKQVVYGIFALGWRGSARHWQHHQAAYVALAALATPLVVSVHSVVSLDFTVAIVPGYHSTILPPYFVAGALYSGFAMVLTIAVPLRHYFRLGDVITPRHLDLGAKVMLASGMVVAYAYVNEIFFVWYSGEDAHRTMLWEARMTGPYAGVYWSTLALNTGALPLLFMRRVRRSPLTLWIVAVLINVGMWLERYMITVSSLARGYLPSTWRSQEMLWMDFTMLFGSIGMFFALIFLFIRILPALSIFEVSERAEETRNS
jgi:molybdopterin-containing oxidoreductase family membrane subunit